MDRFYLFMRLITLMNDDCDVIDAKMYDLYNRIEITGVDGDNTVIITAELKKEAKKDGD